MAVTTCPQCAGHEFESAFVTPRGERETISVLQCAGCGAPMGTFDPHLCEMIESLRSHVASIDSRLTLVAKALARI